MKSKQNIPLAEQLRPKKLDDIIGQKHLLDKKSPFRKSIDKGLVPSMIFWGPPGVGKTTLSKIIAESTSRPFYTLSAINSGVKEVREIIQRARSNDMFSNKPILFIDEIHRFSKSQQDSLLGAVEQGTVTLIGATTENPSFEVIPALLSRSQVYVLEHLSKPELIQLVDSATKFFNISNACSLFFKEKNALIRVSGGDARKLLNALELVMNMASSEDKAKKITNEYVTEIIKNNINLYDKSGEQHYDIISAFIKSIRGSDPNAAVYWLARMIDGGEDVKFIARRLVILASEDIGNANPTALVIALNCFNAVNVIGNPESRIILSQATTYLASSPKSNASYEAINKALQEVQKTGQLTVPLHLRNAPTKLMKDLDYGKEYKYSHSYENNFIEQEFLPDEISGTTLFEPGQNTRENEMRKFLKNRWKEKYNY